MFVGNPSNGLLSLECPSRPTFDNPAARDVPRYCPNFAIATKAKVEWRPVVQRASDDGQLLVRPPCTRVRLCPGCHDCLVLRFARCRAREGDGRERDGAGAVAGPSLRQPI